MNDLFTRSWNLPSRSFSQLQRQGQQPNDVEMGRSPSSGPQPGTDMRPFEQQVATINRDIDGAQGLLTNMQQTYESSKLVVRARDVKREREKMEQQIGLISTTAKTISKKLQMLSKDNEENRQYPGCAAGSVVDQQRMNMTKAVGARLRKLFEEFQSLRQKMGDEYRAVVDRRIYTVTGEHASQADIDRLVESGNSEGIFQVAVQRQGSEAAVRDTIAELEERHDAVKELERGLQDLKQTFLDMAVLVESQGEVLNEIELNVNKADVDTTKGVGNLNKAWTIKKNTRWWKFYGCIACVAILVVLLIVLLPTLLTVLHSSN